MWNKLKKTFANLCKTTHDYKLQKCEKEINWKKNFANLRKTTHDYKLQKCDKDCLALTKKF
jgi:hypothetical protein